MAFLLQQIFHRQTQKRQAQIRQTVKDTVFGLMKKSPVITASAEIAIRVKQYFLAFTFAVCPKFAILNRLQSL